MLDLDGTTIPNRKDGTPSVRVIKAIAKAQKVIHVSTVTARPLFNAYPIIKTLKLKSLCIIEGGAQILDPSSSKILWQQPLEENDAAFLWKYAQKHKFFHLASDGTFKEYEATKTVPKKAFNIGFFDLTNDQANTVISDLSHIPTISINKIVSWNHGKIVLTINHVKATKQYGILKVAELLKIDTHEIIGIGDGYNDFPLLMACGLKVAIGNAVPELKAIADYIAPTVEEDGVVDVIEKFVLNP